MHVVTIARLEMLGVTRPIRQLSSPSFSHNEIRPLVVTGAVEHQPGGLMRIYYPMSAIVARGWPSLCSTYSTVPFLPGNPPLHMKCQ